MSYQYLTWETCESLVLCGVNPTFAGLSPRHGQVAHALRTRAPLSCSIASYAAIPFDLHVLGLPLAFILSQDQTLHSKMFVCSWPYLKNRIVVCSKLNWFGWKFVYPLKGYFDNVLNPKVYSLCLFMISSFKERLRLPSRFGYLLSGFRLPVNLVCLSRASRPGDPVSCGTAKVEEVFVKAK